MMKTRYGSILAIITPICLTFVAGIASAEPPEQKAVKPAANAAEIQKGATVRIEFTLTDDKGKLLDTNRGREPLTYIHGEGQIIPGLEKALTGLHAGDEKHVVVPPEEGYGPVKFGTVMEVPKGQIPPQAQRVGATFMVRVQNAPPAQIWVKEVKEKTIVLYCS